MSASLAHFPSQIIIQALVDTGDVEAVDNSSDWQAFSGLMPDNPTFNTDNVVAVYDTTPITQGRDHTSGETLLHWGIQVLLRSAASNDAAGQTKIMDIATTFDETILNTTVTIDSNTYTLFAITRISGPFTLGGTSDASRRRKFSLNVIAAIRQET